MEDFTLNAKYSSNRNWIPHYKPFSILLAVSFRRKLGIVFSSANRPNFIICDSIDQYVGA